MTLRTRIAAIAGLAVAVTVLAATATVYLSVRSNLRSEVERGLTERAAALRGARRPSGRRPRFPGGDGGPGPGPARGFATVDSGRRPGSRPSAAPRGWSSC